LTFDRSYYRRGYRVIAGVDEAGRGPWAGPVVAAAVILPESSSLPGLNDSKKLSPKKREALYARIREIALGVGVGTVRQDVIDSVNILQATYMAMREALRQLSLPVELVLVDGRPIPALSLPQAAIPGGDAQSAAIAAASIIAKVTRDRLMEEYSRQYPHYRFHQHKGYGTPEHYEALRRHGPCSLHRKTFAPVRKILEGNDE
ncbi:MAG: ribonuclease HII, partial [Endomicrobiales bacterium]